MPTVLQQLMRHESIETTMRYYVGANAAATADAIWEAVSGGQCNTLRNSGQNQASEGRKEKAANHDE